MVNTQCQIGEFIRKHKEMNPELNLKNDFTESIAHLQTWLELMIELLPPEERNRLSEKKGNFLDNIYDRVLPETIMREGK